MTQPPRTVLFAYGFRPFFLAAGWFSAIIMAAWLWVFSASAQPLPGLPAALWHGHEMLFGFISAAIAGFMLTAVPSWTGRSGFAGLPLAILASAWLLGRVAFALAGQLPVPLVAALELVFLPALTALLAPALLRVKNRNTPLLAVLASLWACDATFVYAWAQGDPALARACLLTSLNIVLLLITLIGGRIVPAFTGNALRRAGVNVAIPRLAPLEMMTIGGMVAIIIVDLAWSASRAAAVVALVAGVLHLVRLARWHGWRTWREPIVWVLHVAYLWLPLGLLLKGLHLWLPDGWTTFWLHALGAGAAGTMILAVMSRASLGHTGRPLVASRWTVVAYLLLTVGVAARVFGPALFPGGYLEIIALAAGLWMAGFVLFALNYTPVLLSPRVDGKPG